MGNFEKRESVLESRRFTERGILNCKTCNSDLTQKNSVIFFAEECEEYISYLGNCKKCADELIAYKAKRQAKFVTIGIIIVVILFLFLSIR